MAVAWVMVFVPNIMSWHVAPVTKLHVDGTRIFGTATYKYSSDMTTAIISIAHPYVIRYSIADCDFLPVLLRLICPLKYLHLVSMIFEVIYIYRFVETLCSSVHTYPWIKPLRYSPFL